MKLPLVRLFTLAAATASLAASSAWAEDLTPPVVVNPIADLTVKAGAAPTVIKLKKTFGLQGVTGSVVRFTTSLGNLDIELDAADYPLNVANFLGYVNSGAYNNTFVHRSIANFIFQGGKYIVGSSQTPVLVPVGAAVQGEHKGSNVRGTIAIALMAGTNSASSGSNEWFFNLVDNTALDTFNSNQGPFTAFGRVIENGLSVMDAIGQVKTYNASGVFSNAPDLTDLPLINYQTAQGTAITPDLVYITRAAPVPLTPQNQGDAALLTLKVKGNTNPALVTATLSGRKLTLTYAPGQTGSATFKVKAIDSAGTAVAAKFTVTVQ